METSKEKNESAEECEFGADDTQVAISNTEQPALDCMRENPKVILYSLASCLCALLWGL
jgi:hypothetical protein